MKRAAAAPAKLAWRQLLFLAFACRAVAPGNGGGETAQPTLLALLQRQSVLRNQPGLGSVNEISAASETARLDLAANQTSAVSKTRQSRSCPTSVFDGKFDLVIPWWTNSPQSAVTTPGSFVQQRRKARRQGRRTGIENQREIMYLLRGAEQFGLLEHVRKVFVVMDEEVLQTYGAPRDLDWTYPMLHLVTDDKLGVKGAGGYASKLASLHKIPEVGDWILVLWDDVLPTHEFSLDAIYDQAEKKPLVRLGVDPFRRGWCGDPEGKAADMHGPWFVSRCRLEELEQKYPDRFNTVRTHGDGQKNRADHGGLDVQCLYDNWGKDAGWAKDVGNAGKFMRGCHTNGGCTTAEFTHPETMFMNLQGHGVSDDYHQVEAAELRKAAAEWLHSYYPTPSRFEKKQAEIKSSWGAAAGQLSKPALGGPLTLWAGAVCELSVAART